MRKITADYIYPISSEPIKNGVITIDNEGLILNIESEIKNNNEEIESHKGIICPGFVNTHCHLELAHMQSIIAKKTGMAGFIKEIVSKRSTLNEQEIEQRIEQADKDMTQNGIVAIGDISNNNSSFKVKQKSKIAYHTFVEAFDINPEKAHASFDKALSLQDELNQFTKHHSIVPHAPYTVSEKLLGLINIHASNTNAVISIHNQESEAESQLFISHSGSLYDTFKAMGINTDILRKTGVNSLQSTLPHLSNASSILLVHNTYTSENDIKWAQQTIKNSQKLYWCTCPNANLYIENKLPNYTYFTENNCLITIGTDSLASNTSLSILDELKTISKHYPQIDIQTLLTWATQNGADCLGFKQFGTIEKGKKPGLNLLTNMSNNKINPDTQVIKLV
jgi:cytosine/adenosine deaminase-related metal-dependent hydrolase